VGLPLIEPRKEAANMRIDTNVLRAVNHYNTTVKSLANTSEQLSSGSRISRAANDTTAMVMNAKIRAQLNGLQQGARNAQEGINVLNVADAALGSIGDQLTRAMALAVGAASTGSNDADAVHAFDTELQDIVAQIDNTASQAAYATVKLLDGSYAAQSFMIGDSGANILNVTIGDARSAALSIDTLDLALNPNHAIDALKAAIAQVSTQRSELGAVSNRLQATVNVLQNTVENLLSAGSRIADTDMTKAAAKLERDKVMLSSGAKAIDRAMASTVQVLRIVK
jgi:flagellin